MTRWISFDIEIAALIPEGAEDWKQHRPLGITCAAVAWQNAYDGDTETMVYHGKNNDSEPMPRMTKHECQILVHRLRELARQGHTILGWNSLGFDFNILAEESGMRAECVELALHHTDMMFQVFCERGHPLGLDAAARGMGLAGKIEGVNGALAPQLWAQGEYDKVLQYVAQDAKATLEIALEVERRGHLCWTSKKGRLNRLEVPRWLTVFEAMQLPEPENKWLSNPWPRSKFTGWMERPASPGEHPPTP